jgi:hypothetical protein
LPRLALALAALVLLLVPSTALANGSLSAGIDSQLAFGKDDDGNFISGDPFANVTQAANELGAQTMRVHAVWWYTIKREDRAGTGTTCGRPAKVWSDPANYDWKRLDSQLDTAKSKGLRIILQLTSGFPCWASHDPGTRCAPGAQCVWRPNKLVYADWVRALMKHLIARGDLVNRISPWNEPNNPQFLQISDPAISDATTKARVQSRDRALAFRDLWFNARKVIRDEFPQITAPLWFGDLQQSDNVFRFTRDAFCYPVNIDDPANPVNQQPTTADPQYLDCADPLIQVDAEAVTFHTYLNENSPEENLVYMRDMRKTWSRIRNYPSPTAPTIDVPSYFAITESGVHHNQTYAATATLPERKDARGTIRANNPAMAAAHLNCLEHNIYRDPRTVGLIQYLLNDAPGTTGDTTFTGLNFRDGTHKPMWSAWRMPLTVHRTSPTAPTNLRAWGAYRPYAGGRPAAVTLVGLSSAGSIVWQKSVPLTASVPTTMSPPNGGYFLADFTDAPTTAVQFETRANGITSRRARVGDCNQDSDRNGTVANTTTSPYEVWSGGDAIDMATSPK